MTILIPLAFMLLGVVALEWRATVRHRELSATLLLQAEGLNRAIEASRVETNLRLSELVKGGVVREFVQREIVDRVNSTSEAVLLLPPAMASLRELIGISLGKVEDAINLGGMPAEERELPARSMLRIQNVHAELEAREASSLKAFNEAAAKGLAEPLIRVRGGD